MTNMIRNAGLRLSARIVFGAAIAIAACSNANADFTPYIIRNSTVGDISPTINPLSPTGYEFFIAYSGQKAGLGSNDVNGATLGDITSVGIDRLDDHTRFDPGTIPGLGPYTAPYLNFWITNGVDFAIASNSSAGIKSLYDNGYHLTSADLMAQSACIYESSNTSWLANGCAAGVTFQDLAGFTIQTPSAAILAAAGTGAPHDLFGPAVYGVNWVFGDTLDNYISGSPGYKVDGANVAVPEPGSIVLLLTVLGAIGVTSRRRLS
jgi:hypothetical protein